MCDRISGNVSILGGNDPSINDKKIFESTGGDSGFLSGPQDLDSLELEEEYNRDSAASVGQDANEDDTKNCKETSMILDSGVYVGLSEWFCALNLKNSSEHINNLDDQRKSAQEPKSQKLKGSQNRPLWQICYIQDDDGDTQLHLSVISKSVEAVAAIIRLAPVPALLDIRNDEAYAPLHLAVLTSQPEVVRRLLIAGAKATVRDRFGNSPLHLACMNNDKACVDALTSPLTVNELQQINKFTDRIPQVCYPDLEQRNYDGQHCVHIAAQRNNMEILIHLVWLGADVNAREGKSGYTVLHFACENSNEQMAQFLLNKCSNLNVDACTYGLLTAYQIAAELKNQELMSDLENFGAELLAPPESEDEDIYSDSCDEDF